MAGGEPHPGRGEVAAPVLILIAVGGVRRGHFELLAVEGDGAGVLREHAVGVPGHVEQFQRPHGGGGGKAHVPGDFRFDLDVPFHVAGVTHPFGMGRGVFGGNVDGAAHDLLIAVAVSGLHIERRALFDFDALFLPAEEAVELRRAAFAPGTDVNHDVGGADLFLLVFRELAEHRLLFAEAGVHDEVFHKEHFGFAGLLADGGDGVPPPVIALFGKPAVEHELVLSFTVFVEHAGVSFPDIKILRVRLH